MINNKYKELYSSYKEIFCSTKPIEVQDLNTGIPAEIVKWRLAGSDLKFSMSDMLCPVLSFWELEFTAFL